MTSLRALPNQPTEISEPKLLRLTFSRAVLSILVLLLLLSFALRVYHLGDKTVWWDEAWSVWTAQQSFAQTTEDTARDVHPPLYEWSLYGWVRIAGISEFSVRYLSLLAGLLAVAVVYPLTLRLSRNSRLAALLAVLFVTLSALDIRWSQETRMYAMASFTAAIACYAYLRVRVEAWRWWFVLITACASTPLTHYLGIFVVIILNIHWLLTLRKRSRAFHLRWIGAMIVVGLIIGAWMAFAVSRIRSGGTDSTVAPTFIFQLAATLIAVGTSVNVEQYVVPTLIATTGLFAGLILYTRRQWQSGSLILLMTLFPPFAIFLLSMPNRFYHPRPEERYLVIFLPVIYAGVGIALMQLRRMSRWLGIVAVLWLVGVYGYIYLKDADTRYYRDDYAMMLRTVNLLAKPDEPVYFVSGDRYPLVFYHLNRAANGITPLHVQEITRVNADTDVNRLIIDVIGNKDKFWLVEIEKNLGDPQNKVIPYLDSHYKRILHIPIDYNGITYYAKADAPLPDSSQVLAPVMREVRPGDTLRMGIPANTTLCLNKDTVNIQCATSTNTWTLAQIPIYPAYPSGHYQLANDSGLSYPVIVTHSQGQITPTHNLNVSIGPLTLLGYSTDTTQLHPGASFTITFYWQVNTKPDKNYTVFAHLLGPFNPATNGPLWAGLDSYPANTPTTTLWPGLVFVDQRQLTLPADTPPGPYTFEIGLYELETGQRVINTQQADHAMIEGFTVVP